MYEYLKLELDFLIFFISLQTDWSFLCATFQR